MTSPSDASAAPDVQVVGAGLSGLAAAWALSELGARVSIVEASADPGGLIRTRATSQGLVETAARAFVWSDRAAALFASAGITPQFAEERSRRRYIFRNGQPRRWPLGPIETLGLAARGASAWLIHQTQARDRESVAAWSRRVLGPSASTWLVAPALQGIYAASAADLSARAIFGRRKAGSPARRLRGRAAAPPLGMSQLFEALRDRLAARGARFTFNRRLDPGDLSRHPPTIVCTDAPAAARLLQPHAPRFAEAAARVRMSSLLSVTAFYPAHEADVRGFGILFPAGQGITALGVLFNTDIFTNRGDGRSETWIYGSTSRQDLLALQSRIVAAVRADREVLTGRNDIPVAMHATPTLAEIPVYDDAVLAAAERAAELPPWLGVTGNYLGRLGVSALIEMAEDAARRLAGPARART